MIKSFFLKTVIISLIIVFGLAEKANAQRVAITTSPATAKIYVDGRLRGTGSFILAVGKNDCLTVEVKEEGYMSEVRTYCKRRGYEIGRAHV